MFLYKVLKKIRIKEKVIAVAIPFPSVFKLAAETATGQGETLAALSELIGVDAADAATFNTALKANFDQIFSSEEVTSGQAYNALVSIMMQDITLSKYVNQA